MQIILTELKNYIIGCFSSPAQIIGFIALIIAVLSFQQRTRKGILLFQCFSMALFCIHYAMLGPMGLAGSALNFLSGVRSVIYYNKDKKWAKSKWWPALFIAMFTIVTCLIMIWGGDGKIAVWYNLFPLAGAYVYTLATYTDSPKIIRRTLWISSVVWIIYNFKVGSAGGVITEIISLVSQAVAILRFDVFGKNSSAPQ